LEKDVWRSDGTLDGTIRINDFESLWSLIVGNSGDHLIFFSEEDDDKIGGHIYKTNILTNEISILGLSDNIFRSAGKSISLGEDLIAWLQNDDYGMELWKLNASSNTITTVKDINSGVGSSYPYQGNFQVTTNNRIVFSADDGIHGVELWVTDGTELGTQLVKDISSQSSFPDRFSTVDNKVFFKANDGIHGDELWVTDGTNVGTQLVKDINVGEANGFNNDFWLETMASMDGKVFFLANDGEHGNEPWVSDGTLEGTIMLKDINSIGDSNAQNFYVFKNKIYFAADDGVSGMELWVTNGTKEGTMMADLVGGEVGSNPFRFMDDGTTLFFLADRKIWRSGGTASSTEVIAEIEVVNGITSILDGYFYFKQHTNEVGRELFRIPIDNLGKYSQNILFESLENKTIGDAPFKVTASASSEFEVMFTSTSDKITIAVNEVTLIKPGRVTIHADQVGDDVFEPAPTVSQTFCINPAQPTITLSGDLAQPVLTSSSTEGNLWCRDDVLLDETTPSLSATESGTYKVQVVIEGCESEFSEGKAVVITGIETEGTMMELHPNPTSGSVNISIQEEQTVQIINNSGTILFEETLPTGDHQLDISGYPSGVYILKLISGTGTEFKRWVKQ
jgi:ELWxxDGT repeat protein